MAAGVDVAGFNAVDSGFFFLSFYYIIPGELPFGFMFGDSWVPEGSCRSKHHIYT